MRWILLFALLHIISALTAQSCTALFTHGETGLTIDFTDLSTSDPSDPISSWLWNFDDGGTSNEQNPTHTFPSADRYDVLLEIVTASGCTSDVEIRIETCVLSLNYTLGSCAADGLIPMDITITDVYDNADEVDILLDGQSVPGSPFEIDGENPLVTAIDISGDGLAHILHIQSTDIATCGTEISVQVEDCSSDCFLSAMQVGYSGGSAFTVEVGDDFFSPETTTITIGDVVNFQWVGDGHSTTSDASAGDDAWNSGVISLGSSFEVQVRNPGLHPYYCIPHGAAGGVGMSGTIVANCSGTGDVDLEISFMTTMAGPEGYNVLRDGIAIAGSPFDYAGTGLQSLIIPQAGDGLAHTFTVEDVADPTCSVSRDFVAPDCGAAPSCSISMTAMPDGNCDAMDHIAFLLTINSINTGPQFTVIIDGTPHDDFTYDPSGTSIISINLPGDGATHLIEVQDTEDPGCNAALSVVTTDCSVACEITQLEASLPTTSTVHRVDVLDFDFDPADITISSGDQVEWVFVGDIDHTTTSDATSGADSWDSGLLGTGGNYLSPILSEGLHPYYCAPHGAPGGVGMSGAITVQADCADNQVPVLLSFMPIGTGIDGYQVDIDGLAYGSYPYDASGSEEITVLVLGDGLSHDISVTDLADPTCFSLTSIVTPDCEAGMVCTLSLELQSLESCDDSNEQLAHFIVSAMHASSEVEIFIDGVFFGESPIVNGDTEIQMSLPGDGATHLIEIRDKLDPSCAASSSITTTDCTLACHIDILSLETGRPSTYTVRVEDFTFTPAAIDIRAGDTVRFEWTGDIPHTATSDATSGIDQFDSGLLELGATYDVIISEPGDHPYYCAPHGAAGGVGMSGVIVALGSPLDSIDLTLVFAYEGTSSDGFDIGIDGIIDDDHRVENDLSGHQQVTVRLPRDGSLHMITLYDISVMGCQDSIFYLSPSVDSSADNCSLEQFDISISECEGSVVTLDVSIKADSADESFHLYKDGIMLSEDPLITDDTGSAFAQIPVSGNGQSATIVLINDRDATCRDTVDIALPDCGVLCLITDFTESDASAAHILVKDFAFDPSFIEVSAGQSILFDFVGEIPHTATSDVISGANHWDSGLLGQGDTFVVSDLSLGDHPYYCSPHGGPGGLGMAGMISVIDTCENDKSVHYFRFDVSAGSPLGYHVFLDGIRLTADPYSYDNPSGTNRLRVELIGDGRSHLVTIQDVETPFCASTLRVQTHACGEVCIIDSLLVIEHEQVYKEIEVRDYDFLPQHLSVQSGQNVRFVWTGSIPHTSTSDAIGGSDSWDSGLLGQGDTFDLFLEELGNHPYYCTPHGGPAGIGMAGVISLAPACIDGRREVHYRFDAFGGSDLGYFIYVDGVLIDSLPRRYQSIDGENQGYFLYEGDGSDHVITIQDAATSVCARSSLFSQDNCVDTCSFGPLTVAYSVGVIDTVLVEDFDFTPRDIEIENGDIVRFLWTGEIPHTVSSDSSAGPTHFDSGLLEQGATYDLSLDLEGTVPYYCIPHGSPGGIGMSGTITYLDPCTDGMLWMTVDFLSSRHTGRYEVVIDDVIIATFDYSRDPMQSFSIELMADGREIDLRIVDKSDSGCTIGSRLTLPDCNDVCYDVAADFEITRGAVNRQIVLSDLSRGRGLDRLWTFGDGNNSTIENPVHFYTEDGVYDVCLFVSNGEGCTDSICEKIVVDSDLCRPHFEVVQDGLDFLFINTSTNLADIENFQWDMGDGTLYSDRDSVLHRFDNGRFLVCLRILDADCEESYCQELILEDVCLGFRADFSVENVSGSQSITLHDNTEFAADAWLWGFGDGNISREQHPSHTFDLPGIYKVCLVVSDSETACRSTVCKEIVVGTVRTIDISRDVALLAFPNPSAPSERIHIIGWYDEDIGHSATLKVHALNGQLMHQRKITLSEMLTLDLELSPGPYYISCTTSQRRYITKIVSQ